ncbi:MAG TPA: hypothetical protein VGG34_01535 [Opitutaceae bacterium]|jgi:hypothetical protein
MALQKTIDLPNGTSGNYIKIVAYRWDTLTETASALFALYLSQAQRTAAPKSTLMPVVAKLRLHGAKFNQYLANSVLDPPNVTVLGQLYAAAKVEPLKSDFQPTSGSATVLSDATNV